ncbi:hypothetical protein AAFF_G00094700 [Aldrovandia affinis]|uniref:Uncharacterized protein n=1 Tax=Aldrovandia affinis TaxID=143900 RepID=A0AAD7WZ29_9TELE|nr:hypothetical protein AAFF_G00094700 [Aldrovandia affinis]
MCCPAAPWGQCSNPGPSPACFCPIMSFLPDFINIPFSSPFCWSADKSWNIPENISLPHLEPADGGKGESCRKESRQRAHAP